MMMDAIGYEVFDVLNDEIDSDVKGTLVIAHRCEHCMKWWIDMVVKQGNPNEMLTYLQGTYQFNKKKCGACGKEYAHTKHMTIAIVQKLFTEG